MQGTTLVGTGACVMVKVLEPCIRLDASSAYTTEIVGQVERR